MFNDFLRDLKSKIFNQRGHGFWLRLVKGESILRMRENKWSIIPCPTEMLKLTAWNILSLPARLRQQKWPSHKHEQHYINILLFFEREKEIVNMGSRDYLFLAPTFAVLTLARLNRGKRNWTSWAQGRKYYHCSIFTAIPVVINNFYLTFMRMTEEKPDALVFTVFFNHTDHLTLINKDESPDSSLTKDDADKVLKLLMRLHTGATFLNSLCGREVTLVCMAFLNYEFYCIKVVRATSPIIKLSLLWRVKRAYTLWNKDNFCARNGNIYTAPFTL